MQHFGPQELSDHAEEKMRIEKEDRELLNDAAPDMYDALKDLVECSPCQNGCDPEDMTCATNRAIRALDKATGR